MKKILLPVFFSATLLNQSFSQNNNIQILNEPGYLAKYLFDSEPNGNIWLYVGYVDTTSSTPNTHIIKLNSSGTILMQESLNIGAYSAMDISYTADGGLAILHNNGSTFKVDKVDASGIPQWSNSYTLTDFYSTYYSHSLNTAPDGSIYITISDGSYSGIIKLNSAGNMQWATKITGDPACGKCPGFRTTITDDGDIINTLKDESYECVTKLDPNGQLIWSKSFNDGAYRWPEFIKSFSDNSMLIAGNNSNTGAYFQKLDANGNIIMAKDLTGHIYGVQIMDNGDFYLIAATGSNVQVLHFNSTGVLQSNKAIGYTTTGFGISADFPDKRNVLNFPLYTGDGKPAFMYFDGNTNDMCNTFVNPVTIQDDIYFETASVDTIVNITPLTVTTVANTLFTASPFTLSGTTDFCDYLLAIGDIKESAAGISAYPNPSDDFFTVETTGMKENSDLFVYDSNGRLVMTKRFSGKTQVNGLSSGLYNVCVTDGEQYVAERIVVK